MSFAGKWFGGYARGNDVKGNPRNYAGESRRAIQKQASAIHGSEIFYREFEDWNNFVLDIATDGLVVYCDPPYASTLSYSGALKGLFSHESFWKMCNSWVDAGAIVLVSEQIAPSNWIPIFETSRLTSTGRADQRKIDSEFVFVHESQVIQ